MQLAYLEAKIQPYQYLTDRNVPTRSTATASFFNNANRFSLGGFYNIQATRVTVLNNPERVPPDSGKKS
jgi:hypothetical protein